MLSGLAHWESEVGYCYHWLIMLTNDLVQSDHIKSALTVNESLFRLTCVFTFRSTACANAWLSLGL